MNSIIISDKDIEYLKDLKDFKIFVLSDDEKKDPIFGSRNKKLEDYTKDNTIIEISIKKKSDSSMKKINKFIFEEIKKIEYDKLCHKEGNKIIYKDKSYKVKDSYYTHDNGGRPFEVNIIPGKIALVFSYDSVYARSNDFAAYSIDERDNINYNIFELAIHYDNIWIGDEVQVWKNKKISVVNDKPWAYGNSVLFEKNGLYTIVGDSIFTFKLMKGDSISYYHSPVGNSDVVYPYIVGKIYTYKVINDRTIDYYKNEDIIKLGYDINFFDAYDVFYNHSGNFGKIKIGHIKSKHLVERKLE